MSKLELGRRTALIRQQGQKWKRLPQYTGIFDEHGELLDPPNSGSVDAFPEVSESVEKALAEGSLQIESLLEATIDLYSYAVENLIDRAVFYKNEKNQFLLFECRTMGYCDDNFDPDSFVDSHYEGTKPKVHFFPTIEEAQDYSQSICITTKELPRQYFL